MSKTPVIRTKEIGKLSNGFQLNFFSNFFTSSENKTNSKISPQVTGKPDPY